MNFRAVFHLVSFVPLVLGFALLACWGLGEHFGDPVEARRGFAISAAFALLAGTLLWALTRGPMDLNRRDGAGIVTFGWLFSVLTGAVPFLLCGTVDHPVPALFESVSGFTTTGASVLDRLEELPRSILLWRAVTHFFGGMGILILCVAILPLLGSGGMQIYRAEMAGPSKDRLTPRIASTAKVLWGIYLLLNVVLLLLLRVCGMDWFDSVCHAFATIATGGFSTRTISIAAFHSPVIEAILTVFMFLSGVNFALHWRALHRDLFAFGRDAEFRLYLLITLFAIGVVMWNTWNLPYHGFGESLRASAFTVVSILTTTGFSTADYAVWPALSQYVLVLLMLIGGCAGSTAGGLKNVRLLVLLKQVVREMKLFIQPQAIYQVKVGRQLVEPDIVSTITAFFVIFVMIFMAGSAAMACFTPDLRTAVSSVAATLGNVGPGLGAVGPAFNYAGIPAGGQCVLIACMLLGRLELYTLLVIFVPSFWRR